MVGKAIPGDRGRGRVFGAGWGWALAGAIVLGMAVSNLVVRAAEPSQPAQSDQSMEQTVGVPALSQETIGITGAEILAGVKRAMLPSLSQFELGMELQADGESLAEAVIGWSGEAGGTAALRLPMLPVPIQLALRPSGFAMYQVGQQQTVMAEFLPLRRVLTTGARLFGPAIEAAWEAQEATVVGVETIAGRKAYVADVTTNPEKLKQSLTDLFKQVFADRTFWEEALSGLPVSDEVIAQLGEEEVAGLVEQLVGSDADFGGPGVTSRVWVDATDFVVLKQALPDLPAILAVARKKTEQELRQKSGETGDEAAVQAVVTAAQHILESLRFDDPEVAVDESGHIVRLVNRLHVQFVPADVRAIRGATVQDSSETPRSDQEVSAVLDKLVPAAGQPVMTSLEVWQQRFGTFYLPTRAMVTVKVPAELEAAVAAMFPDSPPEEKATPEASEATAGGDPSDPVVHQLAMQLKWDLSKGVNPALYEAPTLLAVEKGWEEGWAAFVQGDYRRTVTALRPVVRYVPTFALPHDMLGTAYLNLGETWSAISEMEQVVMLQPDNELVKNNLAYLYVDYDIDPARGLELALEATNSDPTNPMFLDTAGWAYFKNGQPEQAVAALEAALEQLGTEKWKQEDTDENRAELEYHLAAVYARLGEWEQAERHVDVALQRQPQHQAALELKEEITAQRATPAAATR